MAGPFGFEKDKFEISQAIGERILLPAVRKASPETLIVADGFSCREQIRQGTGRPAMHLAEVLKMALDHRTLPRAVDRARAGWPCARFRTHRDSPTFFPGDSTGLSGGRKSRPGKRGVFSILTASKLNGFSPSALRMLGAICDVCTGNLISSRLNLGL